MKRLLLVPFLALLCAIQANAQQVENELSSSNQEWLDKDWPITDTLVFDFPNESALVLYFNETEYTAEELTEEFEPLLRKATDFLEFTTLYYRIGENFQPTALKNFFSGRIHFQYYIFPRSDRKQCQSQQQLVCKC